MAPSIAATEQGAYKKSWTAFRPAHHIVGEEMGENEEATRPIPVKSPLDLAHAIKEARGCLERLLHLLEKARGADLAGSSSEMLAVARRLGRERRARDLLLGTALFGEPAWDILLELYVARMEGRQLTTTSVCMVSGAPPTTALRWLTKLEEAKLVRRSPEGHDRRIMLFDLTDDAVDRMTALMSSLVPG